MNILRFNFNWILIPLTVVLGLIVLVLTVKLFVWGWKRKGQLHQAFDLKLFLITFSPEKTEVEEKQQKDSKEVYGIMEQLYNSLSSWREENFWRRITYGSPYLVLEIANSYFSREITFYLSCPKRYASILEKLIHGLYPTAQIEEALDYNIFNPQGATVGGYLKLAKDKFLPIKTYQKITGDPLNSLVNSLTKLKESGEGGAIQLVVQPVRKNFSSQIFSITKEMTEHGLGYSAAKYHQSLIYRFFSFFQLSSLEQKNKEKESLKSETSAVKQDLIKLVEGKGAQNLFWVNLRLFASAETLEKANQIFQEMGSVFPQFNEPLANSWRINKLSGRLLRRLVYQFSFRLFNWRQANLLSSEELSTIFHFPREEILAPQIKTAKSKVAPAPVNLPGEGLILGENIYRSVRTLVKIKKDDRRRHLYIIGQTGTGKSGFLQEMVRQDIAKGNGVALLDPHGDLFEQTLKNIPRERVQDVILFDPSDLERPVGLNMLQYNPQYPEQKTFIVNELINIFDKLYNLKETGGPIFEQYTRNALQLLMDDPQEEVTLLDVPRVLADARYRRYLLDKCQNVLVKEFWEKEAEKAGGEAALQNIVPYITSKFDVFISNDYVRPIIGQPKNSFSFREAMDRKKILLVNLSKGRLGEINSRLLGMIIVGKVLMAALSRVDLPEKERNDFYLYLDEFQNITTESIAIILSEARKYRLNLTIAHQFIGQLADDIKKAVFGNVGSTAVFRVGAEDAEFLVKEFQPIFSQRDLMNLDNFNAYLKMIIDGQTTPSFSMRTFPPKMTHPENASIARQFSRLTYGNDRKLIEDEIRRRREEDNRKENLENKKDDYDEDDDLFK